MSEIPAVNKGLDGNKSTATPLPTSRGSAIDNLRLPEAAQKSKPNWDMSQLRLPQSYSAAAAETVQSSIPVGKPGPQIYFRAHPAWQSYFATLEHENCLYILAPPLHGVLEGELRVKLLVPYITRDGDLGVWPLNPLEATGRANEWTASAHRVLVASRKGWVRMRSNMRLRSYDLIQPKAMWEEPIWPDLKFDDLLQTAFTDCVIDTLDHPVVRTLQGEL